MKKSKVFMSLCSVILSGIFMFTIFSGTAFKKPAQANVRLEGVKGRIYEFGEDILDKINYSDSGAEKPEQSVKVCLGGYPVGLKLYADGVVVVDTESVDTSSGLIDTAKKAGICVGDVIKYVDGKKVTSNKEVSDLIEKSNGKEMIFTVSRNNEMLDLKFTAEFSESEGKYKAGMWIRDSSAGIGTVTFCTQEGYFASLGHAVCDIDTKQVIPICQGDTSEVCIVNIVKGKSGCAGELCGYLENEKTGSVFSNGDMGVYGHFEQIPSSQILEIGYADEIENGDATIFTTLENGKIEEYKIQITSINKNSQDNKHLIVKITDENLINKTGGIIQGMSGSPIVQNGKLVGAITHVFLNDSTGGYGIFAQTMLENVNKISK